MTTFDSESTLQFSSAELETIHEDDAKREEILLMQALKDEGVDVESEPPFIGPRDATNDDLALIAMRFDGLKELPDRKSIAVEMPRLVMDVQKSYNQGTLRIPSTRRGANADVLVRDFIMSEAEKRIELPLEGTPEALLSERLKTIDEQEGRLSELSTQLEAMQAELHQRRADDIMVRAMLTRDAPKKVLDSYDELKQTPEAHKIDGNTHTNVEFAKIASKLKIGPLWKITKQALAGLVSDPVPHSVEVGIVKAKDLA